MPSQKTPAFPVLRPSLAAVALSLLTTVPAVAQIPPTQPPTTPPSTGTAGQTPQTVPIGSVTPIELPSPLTLPQAIDLALRLQPQVGTAVATRERSEQQVKAATARYAPTISPSYSFIHQYNFGPTTQFNGVGTTVTDQGRTVETKQAQFALNYTVFDSGLREFNARSARQSLRVSEYGEENTRQTVIIGVASNYYAVLRNNALVRVAASQLDRAKNTLDVVTAQVAAEVAAAKDILQANADYLNAQVNLLTAQNNAAIAQANLKSAIGLVGGQPLVLADVPAPAADAPITANVPGLDPAAFSPANPLGDDKTLSLLTEAAFRARPDIAQSAENVDVSRTSVRISQVGAGLQVNSTVAAGYQLDPNRFDSTAGNNRQINVNVSYPLFDAGLTRAQVRQSQASVRVAESQLLSLKQNVAVDVEQSYRNLVVARATLPAAKAALDAAQKNYEAAEASRREGVSSIVDVIAAQTSLVQAETNYVQAVYGFYGADAQLARAVGQANRIAVSPNTPNGATPSSTPPVGTPPPASGNPAATPPTGTTPPPGTPPPATPAAPSPPAERVPGNPK